MSPQVKDLSVGHWVSTTSPHPSWRWGLSPGGSPPASYTVHSGHRCPLWVAGARAVQGGLRTIHSPPSPAASLCELAFSTKESSRQAMLAPHQGLCSLGR